MQFKVKVDNVRDLLVVGGVTTAALAKRLGLSTAMTNLKLKGRKSLFLDEVGAIVGAINAVDRMTVTEDQVVKVIGKTNLKVRGFAA